MIIWLSAPPENRERGAGGVVVNIDECEGLKTLCLMGGVVVVVVVVVSIGECEGLLLQLFAASATKNKSNDSDQTVIKRQETNRVASQQHHTFTARITITRCRYVRPPLPSVEGLLLLLLLYRVVVVVVNWLTIAKHDSSSSLVRRDSSSSLGRRNAPMPSIGCRRGVVSRRRLVVLTRKAPRAGRVM